MNIAAANLNGNPKGVTLTAIKVNCGDSGSPQMSPIYFTSEALARDWVANPDNSHRLPKLPPDAPEGTSPVEYRQVEAWKTEDGKHYLYKGKTEGMVRAFVVK